MMVPDPQTAKYVLQMSGTMIKNVKIRVSYNKSMAKMKRGEMTVDDDDFTLIPIFNGAMKMILFNVNPRTNEHDLEQWVENQIQGTVFEVFFSRKSGGPTTAFIYVEARKAEFVMMNVHQQKFHDYDIQVNYFVPFENDFGGNIVFPKDIPGPTVRVVIEELPNHTKDWIVCEKMKAFGELLGYEVNPPGEQPKGVQKSARIYMSQKSAEVAVRFITRTLFYGRKQQKVYIDQEFDGNVPANCDPPQKPRSAQDMQALGGGNQNFGGNGNFGGNFGGPGGDMYGNQGGNMGGNNMFGGGPGQMGGFGGMGGGFNNNNMMQQMQQQMMMMQNQMQNFSNQ